jgi:hypothetical protein
MIAAYKQVEKLENLEKVIVPSIGMAHRLEERSPKLHNKIDVLYPPSSSEEFSRELPGEIESFLLQHDLNILFSGSLYANLEIKQFISALESVNWTIGTKSIGLVLLCTVSPFEPMPISPRIYYGGRVAPELVNQVARRVDLLFLPYPLTNHAISKSSFPSKLAMYAFHKKNIFVMAPADSSLAAFLAQNGMDQFLVTDALSNSLVKKLKTYVENASMRIEQLDAIAATYSKYFAKQVFASHVLGIFEAKDVRTSISHEYIEFVPSGNFAIHLNRLGRRILSSLRYFKRTFLCKFR